MTAGDARELVGFHDNLRNEDCTFRIAEDKRLRCLPTSTIFYTNTGVFSDPACQIPAGTPQGPCAAGAQYAYGSTTDGSCEPIATPLRRIVAPSGPGYTPGQNGCAVVPTPLPNQQQALVMLGEIVPWTDFVEGVETNEPGDGIVERVIISADGARQHLGFRSDKLDADCTFYVMTDGVTRCVPEGTPGSVLYSDSDCSKPALVVGYDYGQCSRTPSTPHWIERGLAVNGCASTRSVRSLRPTTDQEGSYYSGEPGSTDSCRSSRTSLGSNATFRAIDADVTGALPVSARSGGGRGRLGPALVAAVEGAALKPGWHDAERNVDCSFALASDGKVRCLPTGGSATVFFTDGACGASSRVAVLGQQCAGVATAYARVVSQACPPVTRVYAVGGVARNVTNVSIGNVDGRCAAVAGANHAFDANELDPADFVEGVAVTE